MPSFFVCKETWAQILSQLQLIITSLFFDAFSKSDNIFVEELMPSDEILTNESFIQQKFVLVYAYLMHLLLFGPYSRFVNILIFFFRETDDTADHVANIEHFCNLFALNIK